MNCAPKDETLIPIEMFHKIHANPGEEDTVRGISWDSFLPVSIWISGADDFVQEERESQALPLCFSMGGTVGGGDSGGRCEEKRRFRSLPRWTRFIHSDEPKGRAAQLARDRLMDPVHPGGFRLVGRVTFGFGGCR